MLSQPSSQPLIFYYNINMSPSFCPVMYSLLLPPRRMERRILSSFLPFFLRLSTNSHSPHCTPPLLEVILQFAMAQPITSKLATVASLMDDFTRLENNALLDNAIQQGRQLAQLLDERSILITNLNNAISRINELEQDLRATFDHNERLVEQIYTLEVSILDCPTHAHRFASPEEQAVFFGLPPTARRLDFEVVDLTTDEELTDSE